MNEQLKQECELTESQKENVIAGAVDGERRIITTMFCEECRYKMYWDGRFEKNEYFDCPHCGAHRFHGIHYE